MSETTSLKVFHVGSFSLVSNRLAIALDGVKVLFFLENKERKSQKLQFKVLKASFLRNIANSSLHFLTIFNVSSTNSHNLLSTAWSYTNFSLITTNFSLILFFFDRNLIKFMENS